MMVVWMILESGAIYSLAVVFLVAFATMKTRVGGFVSNIFTQLSVSPVLRFVTELMLNH
ncbi:hypothetical protein BDZ94DRAFT_1244341 [Collybia nuda]|uniref:Uncharacterized protein n=1 Tax=Collybia nuda TaxID=64659 RepID=A0A9P5YIP4_9AGAR|nr:hypothetical protein BDZ94DRAFT_1244341 [Collybia nuda]